MTPDQVLQLQHQLQTILQKYHDKVTHVTNDHTGDDYIFTFKVTPGSYERFSKSEKEIKELGYHVDTCIHYENDECVIDISVCYPED